MKPRLSNATLPALPNAVQRPAYNRAKLEAGVVHIGIGAFHRAHQACVFDALVASGDPRWGVRAASLRSAGVRDAMAPQDWLYSLVVEEGSERSVQVIGAVKDVIVAPEEPRRLVEAIAAPGAHLVTVTVTEKGYKLDGDALDEEDPEIRAELETLDSPTSLPGFIAAGLRLRRDRGLPGLTIISCDNLPANGRKLASAVAQLLRSHQPAAADWTQEQCAFPETMVDRIVPATRGEDIAALADLVGVEDRAMVRTEPFFQWVVEDRFAGPRPELEAAGVQLTREVAPWETAKLRLLNGAHSAMAYLGGLAGIETVDAFVAEPWGEAFVRALWQEVETTLSPPPQLDLAAYRKSLLERFANSALSHRLRQIAMDGSQKIPQRLLAPAADRLDSGRDIGAIALAIAAWIRWQGGCADGGEKFAVDDPIGPTTARLLAGTQSARGQVDALLALRSVFPDRLAEEPRFAQQLQIQLERLQRFGAREAVQRFIAARCSGEGTGSG